MTILSSVGIANLRAERACSESPAIIAFSTFFTYVLYLDRCPVLRVRRDSACRMRFRACGLLAKTSSYYGAVNAFSFSLRDRKVEVAAVA